MAARRDGLVLKDEHTTSTRGAGAAVVATDAILEHLGADFKIQGRDVFHGQTTVILRREDLHEFVKRLKDEHGFNFLVDVTCIDYLKHPKDHPERFAVVLHVGQMIGPLRLRIRAYIPEEDPQAPSVLDLYPAAGWLEREAHEMYGVVFEGNPDQRRLLTPDDYDGFPLRKDYPLKGRGYRDMFPKYFHIPEE